MNRVKTGISGFDNLVGGGIPEGFSVLLTGRPGTGKTIFALEYLYNGAMNGEKGMYVAFDSSVNMLKEQAKQFGMDLDAMEKQAKIYMLKVPLGGVKFNLFENINKIKKDMGVKRIVFDGLTMFAINMNLLSIPMGYSGNVASSVSINTEDRTVDGGYGTIPKDGSMNKVSYKSSSEKRMVYMIIDELEKLGTTNIIIASESNTGEGLTMDGVSEYACDGIIELYNQPIGIKRIRTMSVLKMRSTNHSQYIHDFEFSKDGIIVKPPEQL